MSLKKKPHPPRLLHLEDEHHVLDICHGVYGGQDHVPHKFRQWVQDPAVEVYGIEDDERKKVVAILMICFLDDGDTLWGEALRVHRDYRGERSSLLGSS